MALIDDINALPTTVGNGQTGHLTNHQVIHAALKNHESRIPATLAMRLDTTVGTRIFAGTHMLYGDTGWRDVTSMIPEAATLTLSPDAKIMMRRINGDVIFRIEGEAVSGTSETSLLVQVNEGWRPPISTQAPFLHGSAIRHSRLWITIDDMIPDSVIVPESRAGETRWTTQDGWPSTLPGTPA